MTPSTSVASRKPAAADRFVSSDFHDLASHMDACHRSHGRFFRLRSALEAVHAVASPRIVTFVAAVVILGLGLLAIA